jgi:hypothetical protein
MEVEQRGWSTTFNQFGASKPELNRLALLLTCATKMFWNGGPIRDVANKTALNGWYQGFIATTANDGPSLQVRQLLNLLSSWTLDTTFVLARQL